MFDSFGLSFKGMSRKKLRSVLVICLVCIGVFMMNLYVMMARCIIETEKIKAQDNVEYKLVKMIPYATNSAQKKWIRVYDLYDIKEIPHVESVSINPAAYGKDKTYELNIDTMTINGLLFERFYNEYADQTQEFPVYPIFGAFDPYNTVEEAWIRKTDPDYSALLCGTWPKGENGYEIAIDSLLANRAFSLDYEKPDYSSVCGEAVVIRTKDGEELHCTVSGVYSYKLWLDYAATKSDEQVAFEKGMENYRYTEETLERKLLTTIDMSYPIMIPESLAQKLYRKEETVSSTRVPIFEELNGSIDVMVDDIDNVESVMEELGRFGYALQSQIDAAHNAVERFFFYKEAIFWIGITVSVITVLQLINVMIMIVNERKNYMVMLSRVGFSNRRIAHIITGEMMWIGTIGSALGVFGCFVSKFVFSSKIKRALSESGLHRYISLDVSWEMLLATLVVCVGLCYVIGMGTSMITIRRRQCC